MTEVWQFAIPITIALAGIFHFFLMDVFLNAREHRPMIFSWMFFSFILILDAVFSIHMIAQDTTAADLTGATRVAYITTMGSMGWTALYFIIQAFKEGAKQGADFMRRPKL